MRAEEQRVRKLQSEGRITRREADQIVAALGTLENRSASARSRATRYRLDLTALGVLKARFLVGEITRAELNQGIGRIAVTTGLTIACTLVLFMILLYLFDLGGSPDETWAEQVRFALFYGSVMGLATGVSTRSHLRAQVLGLWRLRRKVDIAQPKLVKRARGRCPSCGSQKRQPAWLKAGVSAGWVLMPWLAINELYLGQRLPRRHERCMPCGAIYVACSRCDASVENLDWNACKPFWSSAGMRCEPCGARIPCWRNVFALAIQWPARALAGLFRAKVDARQAPAREVR